MLCRSDELWFAVLSFRSNRGGSHRDTPTASEWKRSAAPASGQWRRLSWSLLPQPRSELRNRPRLGSSNPLHQFARRNDARLDGHVGSRQCGRSDSVIFEHSPSCWRPALTQPRFLGCRSLIDLVVTTMTRSWDRQIWTRNGSPHCPRGAALTAFPAYKDTAKQSICR
jgi:hypothetical protein